MKQHNVELEVRVLRTLYDGSDDMRVKLLSMLEPDYFGFDPAKEVFNRVVSLVKNSKSVPTSSSGQNDPALSSDAQALLNGDIELISQEQDLVATVDILAKFRKNRLLTTGMKDAVETLSEETPDLDNVIESLEETLIKARSASDEEKLYHTGKGSNSAEILERILNSDKPDLIKTGFQVFDTKTGGWHRSNLVVFAANSGGGKSTLALQTAINQYSLGYNVAVISLEMDEEEVHERMLANVSGISYNDIRLRKITLSQRSKLMDKWEGFEALSTTKGNRLSIYCPKMVSMGELVMRLKPMGYDVVYIDYINLLAMADGDRQWQELSNIAKEAKQAASALKNVFVILAQLDDAGNIKYSRGIMEHANFVWTWLWDEKAEQTGVVDIRQKKARAAPQYTFTLQANFELMQYKDFLSAEDGRNLEKIQSNGNDYKPKQNYNNTKAYNKTERNNKVVFDEEDFS